MSAREMHLFKERPLMNRREFLRTGAAGMALSAVGRAAALTNGKPPRVMQAYATIKPAP